MDINKNIWLDIAAGDEKAYEEVYKHFYRKFYTYGLKLTMDPTSVEDAIQEVMIFVWHQRGKLREIKNPPAYIFSVFRNALFKKNKADLIEDFVESSEPSDDHNPENLIIAREVTMTQERDIAKAISFLTPHQKEAVHLRFYHNFSYHEIAEVMGISIKGTYKLIGRALITLRNSYLTNMLIVTLLCNIHKVI